MIGNTDDQPMTNRNGASGGRGPNMTSNKNGSMQANITRTVDSRRQGLRHMTTDDVDVKVPPVIIVKMVCAIMHVSRLKPMVTPQPSLLP